MRDQDFETDGALSKSLVQCDSRLTRMGFAERMFNGILCLVALAIFIALQASRGDSPSTQALATCELQPNTASMGARSRSQHVLTPADDQMCSPPEGRRAEGQPHPRIYNQPK